MSLNESNKIANDKAALMLTRKKNNNICVFVFPEVRKISSTASKERRRRRMTRC